MLNYYKYVLLLAMIQANILTGFSAKELVDHVKRSLVNATKSVSSLNADVLSIEGLTGHKVKHLLNNLCSLKGGRYAEVGTWKGATFISALYNNQNNLLDAIGIDDWSFGSRDDFFKHIQTFLPEKKFRVYEGNCFNIDLSQVFNQKVNIYFYDGDHKLQDHKLAFTYFNSILDDNFIAIIDDYNWPEVREGTQQAFRELNYKIVFEKHLSPDYNGSREGWRDGVFDTYGWWNGLYIAVISKTT